ncbi:hypothetical protein RKD31_000839 [Streptomyces sp. SAI-163]
MMGSRLAVRSARLVLAAAVVTVLGATTTACESGDSADASGSSSPVVSSAGAGNSAATSADGPSTGDTTSADGPSDSSAASGDGAGDKGAAGSDGKAGYGQSCGTNDLDFTVDWKSAPDVDGYYLVTAKAKSGITCYLDVNTPTVSFGSGPEGLASPVGQGGEDPIELSGSAVAYTGINAQTTSGDTGPQFGTVVIALTEDDPEPAELELPDTATVDKPIVTNWSTQTSEVVPRLV